MYNHLIPRSYERCDMSKTTDGISVVLVILGFFSLKIESRKVDTLQYAFSVWRSQRWRGVADILVGVLTCSLYIPTQGGIICRTWCWVRWWDIIWLNLRGHLHHTHRHAWKKKKALSSGFPFMCARVRVSSWFSLVNVIKIASSIPTPLKTNVQPSQSSPIMDWRVVIKKKYFESFKRLLCPAAQWKRSHFKHSNKTTLGNRQHYPRMRRRRVPLVPLIINIARWNHYFDQVAKLSHLDCSML